MQIPRLKFLYGSEPVSFESSLPLHEAVRRLAEVVEPWYQFRPFEARAVGTVNTSRVVFRRVVPFVRNSFKPEFRGAFQVRSGTTLLVGAFSMSPFAKAFLTFWFGFCVLWSALAAVAVARDPKEWLFPLFGLGMLCAGRAIVWLGQRLACKDQQWLSELILKAIAGRPNNSSKPTPLRGAA